MSEMDSKSPLFSDPGYWTTRFTYTKDQIIKLAQCYAANSWKEDGDVLTSAVEVALSLGVWKTPSIDDILAIFRFAERIRKVDRGGEDVVTMHDGSRSHAVENWIKEGLGKREGSTSPGIVKESGNIGA